VEFGEDNSAIVKVKDTSDNGRIWRLNTPEFNKVQILENGFVLKAPNGSKMRVTAPEEQITGEITVSEIRYGGSTESNNPGIGFGDKFWRQNKAIDIPCDGNIEVEITLEK
jgi:hypothetical protein